jgi:hypothetical protein
MRTSTALAPSLVRLSHVFGRRQKLVTEKTAFDLEMERTAKMGGMDSVPPAFLALTGAIVAYFVFLVVSN